MKIFELIGLGIDNCFLGAKDDESKRINKEITSSCADEFAINVHEIGKVFSFLILWRVSSLLWWVHHFLFLISFNIKNYLFLFFALSYFSFIQ